MHAVGRVVTVEERLDVDDDLFAHVDAALDRRRAHVGQRHHALARQQFRVDGGLVLEHVKADTGLIGRELARLAPAPLDARAVSIGVARMLKGDANARRNASGLAGDAASPWSAQDAFQLGAPRRQGRTVLVDGVATKVEVAWTADGPDVSVLGEPPAASAGPPPVVTTVGDSAPVYVLSNMRQVVLDW